MSVYAWIAAALAACVVLSCILGKYKRKRARSAGVRFERKVARKLRRRGYRRVEITKTSGDFGADILAIRPGLFGGKICIQCKKYSKPVGLKAVQEVIGAMKYYGYDRGMVVSTSGFTRAAHDLADTSGVVLKDYKKL